MELQACTTILSLGFLGQFCWAHSSQWLGQTPLCVRCLPHPSLVDASADSTMCYQCKRSHLVFSTFLNRIKRLPQATELHRPGLPMYAAQSHRDAVVHSASLVVKPWLHVHHALCLDIDSVNTPMTHSMISERTRVAHFLTLAQLSLSSVWGT